MSVHPSVESRDVRVSASKMPELIDLTNELLLRLNNEVTHSNLESFTLVCKGIFEISQESFGRNLERKRSYSVVECGTLCVEGAYYAKNPFSRGQGLASDPQTCTPKESSPQHHTLFILLKLYVLMLQRIRRYYDL